MPTPDAIRALRAANPRSAPGFRQSVESAREALRLDAPRGRRRPLRLAVGAAALTAAAAAAVLVSAGSSGPDALAAVKRAAKVSAASAERSGTAVVRITHDGTLWAGATVRWHDDDLMVTRDAPSRKAGSPLLVVGGKLYDKDPGSGRWLELGSAESIDPGSGTTPGDYLAATREDVGGETLQRITGGMSGLTKRRLDDGATVYSGRVAAGLIARETGFKEGQEIRVLPFGFAAHDEAADPASELAAAITVGADGLVRSIAVTWDGWNYKVTYTGLGSTPAPSAPAHAMPLSEWRRMR